MDVSIIGINYLTVFLLKKNFVKNFLLLVMALFQEIKKLFNSRLPDSPIQGVDETVRDLCRPEYCENIGKFVSFGSISLLKFFGVNCRY
jgi:hypothetical protein